LYRGDAQAIAEALEPLASAKGPAFVRYEDESKNTIKARLVHGPLGVEGHHEILNRLHSIQPNLAFTRSTILGALDRIHEAHKASWRMSSSECSDWRETLTRRIRNMCRAVHQGASKRPSAPWVRALPWCRDDVGDADHLEPKAPQSEEAKDASEAKGPTTERCQGPRAYFDAEVLLPYRTTAKGEKEFGVPIDVERATREGTITAVFVDNTELQVADLTMGRLLGLLAPRGRSSRQGELWSGQHAETHHELYLKQRVDRALILVLFEQQRQVLMVRVDVFGGVASQRAPLASGDPTLVAAVQFMGEIGEKYAKGLVTRSCLIELRNTMLRERGLGAKLRRPAASASQQGSKREGEVMKKPAAKMIKGEEHHADGDQAMRDEGAPYEADRDDDDDDDKDDKEGHEAPSDQDDDEDAKGDAAVEDEHAKHETQAKHDSKQAKHDSKQAKHDDEQALREKDEQDENKGARHGGLMKRPAARVVKAKDDADEDEYKDDSDDDDNASSPTFSSSSSTFTRTSSSSSMAQAMMGPSSSSMAQAMMGPSGSWEVDEPPPPPTSFG